jgi:hypothetical protein
MPINYTTVKTNLYNWAVSVLPVGMPVIFWESNAPRPVIPYVTLFISSIVAVNQDWASHASDGTGIVDMKGDRQFTLSIQAYGGTDPLTILENVRSSLQKQTVLDTLRTNGIVFFSSLNLTDISDLIDTEFEKRASLDVLLGIGQTYTDNPQYFDHAEIQARLLDDYGSIISDEIINVPEI